MVSSAIEMTETIETSDEGTIDDGPIVINPDIISKSEDDDDDTEVAEGAGTGGSIKVGTDPEITSLQITYLSPPEQEPVRVLLEAIAVSYDPIVHWEWDFGDNTTKEGKDVPRVFHDYTNEGDYSVSVTVYDSEGRKGMSIMAGMFEKPHAEFTARFVKCDDPLTVKFTDLSSSMGMLLSWEWDFNADGIVDSTDINPIYTFSEPGYYNVTLTVEGTLGQPDSKTWPVLASTPPTSDFMASPIIIGSQLKVDFTDLSTTLGTNDEQLALWQWNFGDGTTSTEQHTTHTYNGMGPFTVSLTVTESDGNCAIRTRTINKANVPDASFIVTPTESLAIQFFNTSTPGNEETSWLWSFGDGFVSNEENPVHTYDESGEYTVSVSIIEHISDPLDPNTMTYVITSASADIEVSDATSTPFTLTIEKAVKPNMVSEE